MKLGERPRYTGGMILTCPACGKRYRVPADAIPPEGKLVRCAACRHGWVALPEEDEAMLLDELVASPPPPEIPAAAPAPISARGAGGDAGGIVASQLRPPSDPVRDVAAEAPAPTPAADWSALPDDPPRRRVWPWLVLAVVVFAAALVAVWAFAPRSLLDDYGIPPFDPSQLELPRLDLKRIELPRLTISLPPLNLAVIPVVGPTLDRWFDPPPAPPSPLRIEVSGERRRLANGTRLLVLSGRVVNPTATTQAVPPISAALVGPGGRAYRWRIDAPVATLPAGQGAAFESVTANWPEDARRLDLGFAETR